MPEWLRALGFDAPRVEVVNAHLAYASRVYAMPADFRPDWRALLMLPAPENPRGGVLTEIERGQWMLTVAGTGGDVPPTDDAGFAAFIDRIGAQPLCDALRHAQPLTPIYGYRRTESRRQRYDALRRMPHGVIVMGDAVAAFNPVYGQGMTAAALGARLLGRALAAPARRGFEITFQRRLARAVFPLWLMAVTEDARYRTTEGVRWRGVYMLLNRYNDWLFQRLPSSPTLAQSFLRVLHVVDAPLALLHPRVIMARLHRR
jgi:2-polyprenyl-6-methoxyphenol hydroxylase-like FAD-dependent oxidoreductase